jgi:hypothetical protein
VSVLRHLGQRAEKTLNLGGGFLFMCGGDAGRIKPEPQPRTGKSGRTARPKSPENLSPPTGCAPGMSHVCCAAHQ